MRYAALETANMVLKLKETTAGSSGGNAVNNFARFVTMLIIFILVLVVTYYTTRFVAGAKKGSFKTGNMEILEILQLGNGKYLQLLRLGSRYVVVAVTKEHVELLTELSSDEYVKASSEAGGSFKEILLNRMKSGIGALKENNDKEGSDE